MKPHPRRVGKWLALFLCFAAGAVLAAASAVHLYLSPLLPDAEALRTVRLQTPLRVYSADGRLMAEFGEMRRHPLRYEELPPDLIHAFLAAEDDSFFHHRGVDLAGLLRAAVELVLSGEIRSGGSTITMQVARNFFLSPERSFVRKFSEILLALRIERELSKEEILTLYANKIFLGHRAYGVEAAARVYYGVSARELSLDQMAMIAGLPKAPSRINPLSDPARATARRNWILERMWQLGYIDEARYREAVARVDTASYHGPTAELEAPWAAEMARQEAIERFGLAAYTDGYVVYTTVDGRLQQAAVAAVRRGLEAYDRRHGYRGPEGHVADPADWPRALRETPVVADLEPAIVTAVEPRRLKVLTRDGGELSVEVDEPLRRYLDEDTRSAPIADLGELFRPGDLVRIRREGERTAALAQLPQVQGALVALDPRDGAIRALVGGYDYLRSQFNRAVQAERQPGSNFKPFIYARALEKGLSPATLINDAPIVFRDPALEEAWRPENDSGRFYGPTPLRTALYRSRNVVSVRLLRRIGVEWAIRGLDRFGFDREQLPHNLSLALGTLSATPLQMARGYAVFANGGHRVEPYLVSRVEDLDGRVLYRAKPPTVCADCGAADAEPASLEELLAAPPPAPQVVDRRVVFLMDSMLKDVIAKGTGRRARALGRRDLAGKTGTTNGPRDLWFSGYSPHLVATVWVGFDDYRPLGRNEFGASAALPIWMEFMKVALAGLPEVIPPPPPGVVTMRIDPATGQPARPGDPKGVFEYFLAEHAPRLEPTPQEETAGALDDLF
ncbi:MAG: peptidoglycan glycosyltransferase [Porticoccaceae bacterium]|nr:MAG: peptidoglycan glycosyltransferase [Porticoccaceae bacterium]